MKYSLAESKINLIANTASSVDEQLRQLLDNAQAVIDMVDRSLASSAAAETEIDAQAADPLWARLQARKNEVKADALALRGSAVTIVAAITTELGRA